MSVRIRRAKTEDSARIAELVEAGFAVAIAPHYGAQGCQTFRRFAAADAIAARLAAGNLAWVAVLDGGIVGYVEMDGDHMRMMFVDPRHQRRGLGRTLMERVLEGREGRTVTVNSAPGADAFYRHMGFHLTGPRQQRNGIVFTPMARSI